MLSSLSQRMSNESYKDSITPASSRVRTSRRTTMNNRLLRASMPPVKPNHFNATEDPSTSSRSRNAVDQLGNRSGLRNNFMRASMPPRTNAGIDDYEEKIRRKLENEDRRSSMPPSTKKEAESAFEERLKRKLAGDRNNDRRKDDVGREPEAAGRSKTPNRVRKSSTRAARNIGSLSKSMPPKSEMNDCEEKIRRKLDKMKMERGNDRQPVDKQAIVELSTFEDRVRRKLDAEKGSSRRGHLSASLTMKSKEPKSRSKLTGLSTQENATFEERLRRKIESKEKKGRRKSKAKKKNKPVNVGWECSACTFQNEPNVTICKICNEPNGNCDASSLSSSDQGSLTKHGPTTKSANTASAAKPKNDPNDFYTSWSDLDDALALATTKSMRELPTYPISELTEYEAGEDDANLYQQDALKDGTRRSSTNNFSNSPSKEEVQKRMVRRLRKSASHEEYGAITNISQPPHRSNSGSQRWVCTCCMYRNSDGVAAFCGGCGESRY